nr:diguanylate cyclase [Lachnospiraceae bacterium]
MEQKRSIKRTLIGLSVVPAVFIGIALTAISTSTLWNSMSREVSNSLSVAAHSVYNTYSLVAPGDYYEEDGVLMKGDIRVEGDHTIVDALKESYGMEITLFYGDERKLTTITDADGNRLTGTRADDQTVRWVLESGREYFSEKVDIGGEDYFGFYIPVLNRDKSVVGMAFAGKKRSEVMNSMLASVSQSMLICISVIAVTLLVCVVASQKIIRAIKSIMEYLGYLAKSDFTQKMPKSVLRRNDEIGEMGKYAETVSKSLKDMITTDPLTGLFNRRACKSYLDKWIEKCNKKEKDMITVAIGDIDFFKKINDTYGHDCGDLVLVTVSDIFKRHMGEDGCVARWGGEEFLLVFEEGAKAAEKRLRKMLEEIRGYEFEYKEERFHITFTCGINGDIVGKTFDAIINEADEYLYKGKTGGRDRIVAADHTVTFSS